jgi:hypothetical protein
MPGLASMVYKRIPSLRHLDPTQTTAIPGGVEEANEYHGESGLEREGVAVLCGTRSKLRENPAQWGPRSAR